MARTAVIQIAPMIALRVTEPRVFVRAACRTGSVETVPKRVSSRAVRFVVTRRVTTVKMIAPRRITATLMRSGKPSVESSTRER